MSSKDSYGTPPEVYAYMNSLYHFVMDVAASDANHLHKRYLTEEQNALALDWRDQGAKPGDYVWCNPPYSNIAPWVSKATEQAYRGVGTVMLVMADQSVGWFAEAIKWCSMVLLVTGGRLSFIDPTTGKPAAGNNKGSMFLIWNPGGLRPHQRMTTEYISRDSIMEVGRGWIDSLAAIHSQPTAKPTETVDNMDLDQFEHPLDMATDHIADVSKMVDELVTCPGCNRQYQASSQEAEFIGWHGECAACQLQEENTEGEAA